MVYWAQNPPDWQEILVYFRGSELQNYFQKILEDDLKAIIKPQYVDNISKAVRWLSCLPHLHSCRRVRHSPGSHDCGIVPAAVSFVAS